MPTPSVSSTPSAPSAKTPTQSAAPSASERFRERVSPERPRESRRDKAPVSPRGGLVPAPDGSFVVMPAFVHHGPARAADRGLKAHGVGAMSPSIDQMRFGAGRDETRLHVRLADGPFAGVEIRGVQRAGRIAIEVVQDPARPTVDLEELRRALAVRGLRSVDLSFADAHHAPRRPPQEALNEDEDPAPETLRRVSVSVRDDEL